MQSTDLTRRQFSVHLWLVLVVPLLSDELALTDRDSIGKIVEKNAMQIIVKRSGGFTGIPLTIKIDTASLSSAKVAQLRRLVDATDFFHLPATPSTPAQPDRYEYEVTVQESDRKHTITFGEVAVPERLRPLLSWLMDAAQQQ